MNFDVKTLESGLKSFQIEIPSEDVNEGLDSCYQDLRQEASIPGFRKGKAPIGILKGRFADFIKGKIFRNLIYPACEEAMESKGVTPLGDIEFVPDLEEIEIEKNTPIRFELVVPAKPEINLPEYEDLEIDKSGIDVTEDEVSQFIEELRKKNAEYASIEEIRPVREGDPIKFDWEYYEDGEFEADGEEDIVEIPIEDSERTDQQYIFARELIGLEVGDEKEIELDFEDDYSDPNLAGKHVKYHVTLQEIVKKVLPELNDEFAEKFEYESYDQMRGTIWNELVESHKAKLKQNQRQEIVDELIEKTDIDVPEQIIEKRAQTIAESRKKRLRRERALSPEDSASREINAQIEDMQDEIHSQALRSVKQSWLFDEIAYNEDIQVTDEELYQSIRSMAQQQGRDPQKYIEMLKATERLKGIRNNIKNEKVLDLLIENASAKQKIVIA